ncbi:hypothetical protein D3C78_925580 [compost metagenome]
MQQVHRQVAIRLQVLHGLLARAQSGNFTFQAGDFLDLLFKHLDFRLQDAVERLLVGYAVLQPPVDHPRNEQARNERGQHRGLEHLLAALAGRLAMGK